jgi:RNA polymerase sigma-70 factor, ECF subfamily
MQEDSDLLTRLRLGDAEAFRGLVGKHQASLINVAQSFVGNRATAEEVVQDTWLAVIEGLAAFEGRSSLKNWMFAILANKARTRAVRDGRMLAAGSLSGDTEDDQPVVDPARFDGSGSWVDPPASWDEMTPERVVAGRQLLSYVQEAIDALPPSQRSVIMLREVEQMTSDEVQEVLGITAANQRVLLHRARAHVRECLERLPVERVAADA